VSNSNQTEELQPSTSDVDDSSDYSKSESSETDDDSDGEFEADDYNIAYAVSQAESNTDLVLSYFLRDHFTTYTWVKPAPSPVPTETLKKGNLPPAPKDVEEAMADPVFAAYWLAAMIREINDLVKNKTWQETVLPKGARARLMT
ncbi:hypothetical protein HDU79_002589, partial [Rhizoclosmatium sp. JEL0117]